MKGVDCLALSLDFLNEVLGTSTDKRCIQKLEGAIGQPVGLMEYKTRIRFLSEKSEEDYFKVINKTYLLREIRLGCELHKIFHSHFNIL